MPEERRNWLPTIPAGIPGHERYNSKRFSDEQIDDYLRAKGVDIAVDSPAKAKALDQIGVGPAHTLANPFSLFGRPRGIASAQDSSYQKRYDDAVMTPLEQKPYSPIDAQISEMLGINPATGFDRDVSSPGRAAPPFVGPPSPETQRAMRDPGYLGYKQNDVDIHNPWKQTELHGRSVLNEYSDKQRILNAWYEASANVAEGASMGLLKFPHPEDVEDDPLVSIAGQLGRLGGEIAVPFKLARGPGKALAQAGRRAMIASDFGGPFSRQLIHHLLESGTTLGLGMGLSDITDPKGAPERIASGFRLGVGFGGAGLISSKTTPKLFWLLRQTGGRVMLGLTNSYEPGELLEALKTGQFDPEMVYAEALHTYFLSHGRNMRDTLSLANTIRGEVEAMGLKGFPSNGKIVSNLRELTAGIKPEMGGVEGLLGKIEGSQPLKMTPERKAGHEWVKDAAKAATEMGRGEARSAMGIDRPLDTTPTMPIGDPRVPVGGPLGPKVAPRGEKPGERNWPSRRDYDDFSEMYAGAERAEGAREFLSMPARPNQHGTLDNLMRTAKTREDIRGAYEEMRSRAQAGEDADAIAADLKSRGFSVRHLRYRYEISGKVASPAERQKAGEPQALPNTGSKYGYGRSMDGQGSTPTSKPKYIETEFGTLWDVVRKVFPSESKHSRNLEQDFGVPPAGSDMHPSASSVARASYWVNERGQFPKTVREAMDIVLKKGIPEWNSTNAGTGKEAREYLQESAEFLSTLEHIEGPMRWGVNRKSSIAGTYERDTGVIWTNPIAQNAVGNFIHEVAHGGTLRFAARMDRENWGRLKRIADDTAVFARGAHLKQYGDKDVGEYAAEHLAEPKFSERNTLLAFSHNRPDIDYMGKDLVRDIAKESRAGIDVNTPVPAENVTAYKVHDHGSTQTWRILGPGEYGVGTRVVETKGRSDAEIQREVLESSRSETEGTFMAGLRPEMGGLEKLLARKAGDVTKAEMVKAEEYLKRLYDEQATPSRVPEAPGINIGKPDRTIVQYGTTDRAALEKQGVEYLSKVGKNQEKLDAYDKANGLREIVETAEPLLDASMRAYPLPRRPAEFAEVFPEGKIFREVKDAAEAIKDGRQGWFETGFRWLERVGGGPVNALKDVFYEPLKRGLDNVQKSLKAETLRMRAIANYLGLSTKAKDSAELMRWLTARQHGGERVLELSGLNELDAGKYRHSPPPEAVQKMMNWMDRQLLQTFHDVNRERIKAGNEPIEWRQDYFTFWHSATALNSLGANLITSPLDVVNAKMAELGRAYESDMSTKQAEMRAKSRFSKWMFQKRTGKLGPVEMDAYGVFTKYMRAAYEQIYLAEAQSIMAKLVDGTWKVDGKEWSMKEANPGLRDSLSDYMSFVATGAKPGEMPKPMFDVLSKLGRNVAVGKVGLNFKSTLNQISSNLHNWSYLGGKYFTEGVADYMKAQVDGVRHGWVEGGKWAEAKDIGDIAVRRREIAFAEFMDMRPLTPWGRGWKKAGEVGMAPLQMMDMVTAEIAWRGAYKKAMDGYADGLMGVKGNHQRSVDFANSTVARSQGSTQRPDLTPFQRGQWGKVASVLQNFVINEWGFVTTDLMGFKSADKGNPEHVKRAVRFMVGALLVDWFYEDVLGVPSPLDVALSPMHFIRPAKKEYDKSGNLVKTAGAVLQAAGETVPIIGRGFNQYSAGGGGFAAVATVQDVAKGIRKATWADFVDAAGSVAGIPGAFAAGRGMRIQKKGCGIMDQIVGTRQEKAKSTGKKVFNHKTGKWEASPGGASKSKKTFNHASGRWE